MATDVSALQIGDLASPTDFRTTRQNDGRRHPGRSAERHIRCARGLQARRPSGKLGHAANRRSGAVSVGLAFRIHAELLYLVSSTSATRPSPTRGGWLLVDRGLSLDFKRTLSPLTEACTAVFAQGHAVIVRGATEALDLRTEQIRSLKNP